MIKKPSAAICSVTMIFMLPHSVTAVECENGRYEQVQKIYDGFISDFSNNK